MVFSPEWRYLSCWYFRGIQLKIMKLFLFVSLSIVTKIRTNTVDILRASAGEHHRGRLGDVPDSKFPQYKNKLKLHTGISYKTAWQVCTVSTEYYNRMSQHLLTCSRSVACSDKYISSLNIRAITVSLQAALAHSITVSLQAALAHLITVFLQAVLPHPIQSIVGCQLSPKFSRSRLLVDEILSFSSDLLRKK